MKRICLQEIDSTNNYVKRLIAERCAEACDELIVTTDAQTAGRGQRGNSWETEPGKNLIFSMLVHPDSLLPSNIFFLSEVVALSVCQALKTFLPQAEGWRMRVKWPNDIYFGDRKIAGILIETDLMGRRVANGIIGVGVNINQQHFLSDAPNPISLQQIRGCDTEREAVLAAVLEHFVRFYAMMQRGETNDLHARYKAVLYRGEGFHTYEDTKKGRFEARIRDVEPTGHLLLEDRQGVVKRYAFKEVAFIIQNQ
ncbi:MAG: biotin--[acetyl-CoA-carboxylase] ligase [Bacteroidales bacterium]|nr:biotin--[acetyl-CoA-carboxylase] ligase [Candidatus Physcousia equi]